MRGFLLDTNIISELRRPRPEPTVIGFVEAQPEDSLFVSEVTLAEIRFGIEQLDDPVRRATIQAWLDHTLRPLFRGRTLPVSEDVILRWRLILEIGRRRGHTFGQLDLLIGATAAAEELVVVSRDVAHFMAAGVPVLNPWTATYIAAGGTEHTISDLTRPGLLAQLGDVVFRA